MDRSSFAKIVSSGPHRQVEGTAKLAVSPRIPGKHEQLRVYSTQ